MGERIEAGRRPQRSTADPVAVEPRYAGAYHIDASPAGAALQKLAALAAGTAQRQRAAAPVNATGLPERLKAGAEALSGVSLDAVRVHRDSSEPARLGAAAHAQGSDIHLGPGQEKHLPHETWHVVQQAQGRVAATRQLHAAVPINDDAGLEAEADVMGQRALDTPAAAPVPPAPLPGHGALQRKLEFAGTEHRLDFLLRAGALRRLHRLVLAAIDDNISLLEKNNLPRLAETRKGLDSPLGFTNILRSMQRSPVEYGEINLDNPQHVFLFVKDAGRFLNDVYEQSEKDDRDADAIPDERIEKNDADPWLTDRLRRQKLGFDRDEPKGSEHLPKHRRFQVALLGTGASVADYINVHGAMMDPEKTVIIGESQPWTPSTTDPRSRGIEFVNHPMSMIGKRRDKTELAQQSDGSDETFAGNAQALSDEITFVLDRFGAQHVSATISKVSKREDGWYAIESSNGTYHALKVVSGLGIGRHKFKKHQDIIEKETEKNAEKGEIAAQRVVDLDTFQRLAKDPNSPLRRQNDQSRLLIGVSGPAAGTDAVYTATELGMFVDWIVSADGPAIAEGMGNKISKKGGIDLFFDYLNSWSIGAAGHVILDIGGKWRGPNAKRDRSEAEDKFKARGIDIRISDKTTALVDYLVIAEGPEVSETWGLFDESVTADLELKTDYSGRFGDHQSEKSRFTGDELEKPDSVQGTARTSLRFADYNVTHYGIGARVLAFLKANREFIQKEQAYGHLFDATRTKVLEILGVETFEPVRLASDVAIGLGSKDNSFEIIGGSASRILGMLDAEKDRSKVPEALRTDKNAPKMVKVLETLSTPTVVNNDQLTPVRSQIEAGGDFMPGYIGREESNFVTDDQTMIAGQIAARYGDIPAELANWITQAIIKDRHDRGVRPGTAGGSRAFIDGWKNKLAAIDRLLSMAGLTELATRVLE